MSDVGDLKGRLSKARLGLLKLATGAMVVQAKIVKSEADVTKAEGIGKGSRGIVGTLSYAGNLLKYASKIGAESAGSEIRAIINELERLRDNKAPGGARGVSQSARDLVSQPAKLEAHLKGSMDRGDLVGVVIDGNFALKQVPAGVRQKIRLMVVQASEALLSGHGERETLGQLLYSYVRAATSVPPTLGVSGSLSEWAKAEFANGERIVSAKAKLATLSWSAPYSKEWVFLGSRNFRMCFCAKDGGGFHDSAPLDADSYRARWTSQPSPLTEVCSPDAPITNFFGDHSFITYKGSDALAILHTTVAEVPKIDRGQVTDSDRNVRQQWPRTVSPRVVEVAPRLIAFLLRERSLLSDSHVLATDIAPTVQNTTVKFLPTTEVVALAGTLCAAIDCYNEDGGWFFNGLDTISEDHKFLLMRSSHCSKAIRLSVLLISSDHVAIFAMRKSYALYGAPCWAPTLSGFLEPDEVCYAKERRVELGKFIADGAKGLVVDRLQCDPDGVRVSLVGFALDAQSGLQPNYFCVGYCKNLGSDEMRKKLGQETPYREHPLVDDNPAVSLSEAYGLARFGGCDLLRAQLFFSWRFFASLKPRPGRQKPIAALGLNGLELIESFEDEIGPNPSRVGKVAELLDLKPAVPGTSPGTGLPGRVHNPT